MTRSASINVRTRPDIKQQAEVVFSNFGITLSDAINIFLHKAIQVGGMPFDVRSPKYNMETEEAIQEARDILSGKKESKTYSSSTELFKELDSEC